MNALTKAGSNILRKRKEMKLTQEQLAEKIGKSVCSVWKYEKSGENLSLSVLCKISSVLGCSLKELLFGESDSWIPANERLPEEHDSVFAKFKGTDKWSKAMFEKLSDSVNVTVEYNDGTRGTLTSYTVDGRWECERKPNITGKKVVAWMPLPNKYEG